MKTEFIFLLILAIIGIVLSIYCLYVDCKHPYEFQNDKVFDITELTIHIILLIVIIKLGVS